MMLSGQSLIHGEHNRIGINGCEGFLLADKQCRGNNAVEFAYGTATAGENGFNGCRLKNGGGGAGRVKRT